MIAWCRNELFLRKNEILFRKNQLLFRHYIVFFLRNNILFLRFFTWLRNNVFRTFRKNEIFFHNFEILFRKNEIKCHGCHFRDTVWSSYLTYRYVPMTELSDIQICTYDRAFWHADMYRWPSFIELSDIQIMYRWSNYLTYIFP